MAARRWMTIGLLLFAVALRGEGLMPTPDDAVPRDPSAASGPDLMPPPASVPAPEPSEDYSSSAPSSSDDE